MSLLERYISQVYILLCINVIIIVVVHACKKGVKGAQPGPVLPWAQRVKIVVGTVRGLE